MSQFLMNTYARLPVAFERGEGAWLWDSEGKRYLDAISGLGVCALGHAHPDVTRAICEQAGRLIHTSNLARIPSQERLAKRLAEISGLERSFIANSGTEAIECAIKICRIVGHGRGFTSPAVIVMEDSFHGRSMAALSATGSSKAQTGFEPLVDSFIRVPYGDIGAVHAAAASHGQVVAVLAEPIQGEAGIRIPSAGYLAELRAACDQNDWLLIFDEIQSGLCRTGRWFAHQHEDALPDIMTIAKALANGLPTAACIARGEAATAFSPGQHGSTFGGNPLASHTACTVLDVLERDGIADNAATRGEWMLQQFRSRLAGTEGVVDIRGRGLMIGIELDRDAGPLKDQALQRGLLMNVTREKVVRLLPPLIIDAEQAESIVSTVSELIQQG